MARHRRKRRGIVLLMVISLLVLFVLIAVTFAMIASEYRGAARSMARYQVTGDLPQKELDDVMYMLLRDTSQNRSAIQQHSLLMDLYGNDGIPEGIAQVDSARSYGQIMEVKFATNTPSAFKGIYDYYNGCVFTLTSGIAKGYSSRIIGYRPPDTFFLESPDNDGSTMLLPAQGDLFVVNGRVFNGPGHGYDATTGNIDKKDNSGYELALMPNFAGYGGISGDGSADESWDAPDFQNMYLAALAPVASSATDILPSFHRPDLIRYWANRVPNLMNNPDLLRRVMIRPSGGPNSDHPNFTGSNATFNPVTGPWDVDNDGDGVADSVWIDPGLPVVTAPNGKRYKRLVAVMVQDLDGRLNLNAHGTLAQLNQTPIAPTNLAGNPASVNLPRGVGFGPAEVNLVNSQLVSGREQQLISAKYGTDTAPGSVSGGDDPLSQINSVGLPPGTYTSAYSAYASPPDTLGRGAIGLDYNGQPRYLGGLGSAERVDDPYELNLFNADSGTDQPYTAAELESLLRWRDGDSARIASRLRKMLGVPADDRQSRQLTTHASHMPVPNTVAIPNWLRTAYQNIAALQTSYGPAPGTPANQKSPTIVDLFSMRILVNKPGMDKWTLDSHLSMMLPFELRKGQLFNVNRLFGNGIDDNGNSVVDEPYESGLLSQDPMRNFAGAYNLSPPFETPKPWTFNTSTNPAQKVEVNANNVNAEPRQSFARQLYCLMMFLANLSDPPDPAVSRQIAQWAINVVDFRDSDAIMTPFEYDTNPFDGWDVDGFIKTDEGSVRNVVWGTEYPDLLLTESLAFHDRRVKDTNYDIKQSFPGLGLVPSSRVTDVRKKRDDSMNPDATMDQYRIPQGSLFVELYCPRNSAMNNPSLPRELYDGNGRLDLARMAPPSALTQQPVWRVVVTVNNPANPGGVFAAADPQNPNRVSRLEPNSRDYNAPDRIIWFSYTAPALTHPDFKKVFWCRDGMSAVAPGEYLIACPRLDTRIGSLKNGSDGDPDTPENSPHALRIDKNNNYMFSISGGEYVYPLPGISIQQPARGIVCAAHPPLRGDGSFLWGEAPGKPQNKNWQVGMNVSEPLPQSGTYYDEPKKGDAYADLKLPYSVIAPNFNYTFTNPFDDNPAYKGPLLNATNKVRTGTTTNFRTLFLQRLANPLLPWNPEPNDPQYGSYYDQNSEVNPYISIDWGTVDLTVFNGDESTNQKITAAGGGMEWIDPSDPDPYDNTEPLERFGTRPRGDKNQLGGNATFDDRLWSPYAMAPQDSAIRTADLDHIFNHRLTHTLGYLNVNTYGPINNTVPGVPAQPFPWLTFNNRPFASPLELLMVPSTAPEELGLRFSTVATGSAGQNQYVGVGNGDVSGSYRHLLNFFHARDNASNVGPQFGRLLDLIETPSPFAGATKWFNPSSFSSANPGANPPPNDLTTFRPPFNSISRFRDPGRININTVSIDRSGNSPLLQALLGDVPGANNNYFNQIRRSRQGYADGQEADYPTYFANPFRSFDSAGLMPKVKDMRKGDLAQGTNATLGGIEATLMRSQNPASLTSSSQPLLSYQSTNLWDDSSRNPYFQYGQLAKLSNIVTTHSNVFAVWITVGYFEVEPVGGSPSNSDIYPDGYRLGQELGIDDGTRKRHRGFYLIDRSIPVAFEPGRNHNVDRAVLVRRYLE